MPIPTYVREINRDPQGRPTGVTIRPLQIITQGGVLDSTIARTIAATLQSAITVAVRPHFPPRTSLRVIKQRVNGLLKAENMVAGGATVNSYEQNMGRLNQAHILDLFERAHQSNQTLLITDLEFTFFIDPSSYLEGGCQDPPKPPSWIKTKNVINHPSWKPQGVNCAAFAICWRLYYLKRNYLRDPPRAIRDAKALCEQLSWEETISPFQLREFIEAYPTYRIAAFSPSHKTAPFCYTGDEFIYNETKPSDKIIYLILHQSHFAYTVSPLSSLKAFYRSQNLRFCQRCVIIYDGSNTHDCATNTLKPISKKPKPCSKCGVIGRHSCTDISCRFCCSVYAKNTFHRCLIMKAPREEKRNSFSHLPDPLCDGELPSLWAYDFEARVSYEESTQQLITEFITDSNGQFIDGLPSKVCIYDFTIAKQTVNFACLKNVFTKERKTFFGPDALTNFMLFLLSYNRGNNICIAHNASGYDTRLLFDGFTTINQQVTIIPIMRGNKFMQLTINKHLIFRDSLLHLPQSLAALAKDFCTETVIEKGFFPHLFNSTENYSYSGPIPPLKYFDLTFLRTQQDREKALAYHAAWPTTTPWVFRDELEKYCINDVEILAEIMIKYHTTAMDLFEMTPWLNSTAPSFVHEVFLVERERMLELPDFKDDMNIYKARVQECAESESWAALYPIEYWFCRRALRGGRTDVRKIYHAITPEQYARGEKICYQDICSEYPFQQVVHDFPVGFPTIHIYDPKHTPCFHHQNNFTTFCSCPKSGSFKAEKVIIHSRQPTLQEQLAFFGFVCISAIPPTNLYHPVLVSYDEDALKCIASLEPIIEQTFTTPEFLRAIERGYTITKIHRYDAYTRKPSLWADTTKKLFIEKMVPTNTNSR